MPRDRSQYDHHNCCSRTKRSGRVSLTTPSIGLLSIPHPLDADTQSQSSRVHRSLSRCSPASLRFPIHPVQSPTNPVSSILTTESSARRHTFRRRAAKLPLKLSPHIHRPSFNTATTSSVTKFIKRFASPSLTVCIHACRTVAIFACSRVVPALGTLVAIAPSLTWNLSVQGEI